MGTGIPWWQRGARRGSATNQHDIEMLTREYEVFGQLWQAEGEYIPVCMGMVEVDLCLVTGNVSRFDRELDQRCAEVARLQLPEGIHHWEDFVHAWVGELRAEFKSRPEVVDERGKLTMIATQALLYDRVTKQIDRFKAEKKAIDYQKEAAYERAKSRSGRQKEQTNPSQRKRTW